MSDDAPRTYGARDLLEFMLEYGLVCPQTTWRVSDRPNEPVLHIRFQRITSLVRALGLGHDASEVVSGSFLEGADDRFYEQALARFTNTYPSKFTFGNPLHRKEPRREFVRRAPYAFVLLYEARVHYYAGQRAGIEVLLASDPLISSGCHALSQLNAQIQATLEPFDAILCFMMDPKQRAFTEDELVADYGWVAGDLEGIEFAYI